MKLAIRNKGWQDEMSRTKGSRDCSLEEVEMSRPVTLRDGSVHTKRSRGERVGIVLVQIAWMDVEYGEVLSR